MTTTLTGPRGSYGGDAVVARRGTDTSGRGIFMSGWMWRCWQALLADPRLERVKDHVIIVQGPWMVKNGGGAADSEGYHDEGGCIDIRTESYGELTGADLDLFILVASEYGFQFWRRDAQHGGMDPHAHGVFGSDYELSVGAIVQVHELLANPRGDGLAGNYGHDYEKRFTPIRVAPTLQLLQGDYMAGEQAEKKLDAILKALDNAQKRDVALRKLVKAQTTLLDEVADAVSSGNAEVKARITKTRREVLAAVAELDQEVPV